MIKNAICSLMWFFIAENSLEMENWNQKGVGRSYTQGKMVCLLAPKSASWI